MSFSEDDEEMDRFVDEDKTLNVTTTHISFFNDFTADADKNRVTITDASGQKFYFGHSRQRIFTTRTTDHGYHVEFTYHGLIQQIPFNGTYINLNTVDLYLEFRCHRQHHAFDNKMYAQNYQWREYLTPKDNTPRVSTRQDNTPQVNTRQDSTPQSEIPQNDVPQTSTHQKFHPGVTREVRTNVLTLNSLRSLYEDPSLQKHRTVFKLLQLHTLSVQNSNVLSAQEALEMIQSLSERRSGQENPRELGFDLSDMLKEYKRRKENEGNQRSSSTDLPPQLIEAAKRLKIPNEILFGLPLPNLAPQASMGSSNGQQNYQGALGGHQNQQGTLGGHQNQQGTLGGHQNHQGTLGSQQNHQGALGGHQNHQGTLGGHQNHQGALGSQQNHQGTLGGHQNHQGALGSQQNHQGTSIGFQETSTTQQIPPAFLIPQGDYQTFFEDPQNITGSSNPYTHLQTFLNLEKSPVFPYDPTAYPSPQEITPQQISQAIQNCVAFANYIKQNSDQSGNFRNSQN